MSRTYLVASLLLAMLAGCSKSAPDKNFAQSVPSVTAPATIAYTPAPSPVSPTPVPSQTASPSPKPAQKKPTKTDKQESGSPLDRFAKCLTDKGAAMYGVFWCDHCHEQKELFGDSFKYVKYVECVTQDAPRTLIPECKAQGIKHTPTWIFGDGSRLEGTQSLATLASKTGCTAP